MLLAAVGAGVTAGVGSAVPAACDVATVAPGEALGDATAIVATGLVDAGGGSAVQLTSTTVASTARPASEDACDRPAKSIMCSY